MPAKRAKPDAHLLRMARDLTAMAELVERNVDTAVMALVDNNARFAYEVIALDTDIDEMEIIIDRQCLALLSEERRAREDFRFVAAAMKINNDLERISNEAVQIAEHVLGLVRAGGDGASVPEFGELLDRIEDLVSESVEALIDRNGKLAWQIWEQHAAGGEDIRRIIDGLGELAAQGPMQARLAVRLVRAAGSIGRVIDYARDIAEEVIYMREGIIVKHHEREFRNRSRRGLGPRAPQKAEPQPTAPARAPMGRKAAGVLKEGQR